MKKNKKYNKSTIFIRPLLGLPNSIYKNNYKNTFITIEPDMKIHLAFERIPDDKLTNEQIECFKLLESLNSFQRQDISDDQVIYTFSPDPDTQYDVTTFLNGKYSKMSEGAKTMIIMSQYNLNNVPVLANILWPNAEARKIISDKLGETLAEDAEVFSSPELEEELLKV